MTTSMKQLNRMMVALTGSQRDRSLIHYAGLIARLWRPRRVTFVHVLAGSADGAARRDAVAEKLAQEVAGSFREAPDEMERCYRVLRGPVIDQLLLSAADEGTELILVGHRPGYRPGRKALIRRLTMKAPCSVWIVPDGSPPKIRRVLVPIDFSSHSGDALDVATDVAARARAIECIALHMYHTSAVITYEESAPVVRGKEQEAYEHFIGQVDIKGMQVRPMFIESEEIAETIHRVALEQNVDLDVDAWKKPFRGDPAGKRDRRGDSRSADSATGSQAFRCRLEPAGDVDGPGNSGRFSSLWVKARGVARVCQHLVFRRVGEGGSYRWSGGVRRGFNRSGQVPQEAWKRNKAALAGPPRLLPSFSQSWSTSLPSREDSRNDRTDSGVRSSHEQPHPQIASQLPDSSR